MAEITNTLTCPSCGGQLAFLPGVSQMQCLHCGNKVQIATGPLCPQCGRAEQIQKVSGLYEANTKEWREGRHNTTRQARTLLGQKLAPPAKPGYPLDPVFLYGIGIVFLVIFIGPFCSIPFSLLLPIGLSLYEVVRPSLLALATSSLFCSGLGLLLALGAVIGLRVWLIPRFQRHFVRLQTNHLAAKAKIDQEDKPRWERAMARWNNLYYCARDETLFAPGENRAIPLDKMKEYLFEAN